MTHLLTPLQAGTLTLKNRLVMPPMATYLSENGQVGQPLLDYYGEKSRGGYFSLVIVEHCYVREDGKTNPKQLSCARDADIAGLRRLADVLHANGSKCVFQINHAGGQTASAVTGAPLLAPGTEQVPQREQPPRAMTEEEIAQIADAFAQAAKRVKAAGADGVEIHSAHGYLLNQFYSPLTNKRTDAYGGSLAGRLRAHLAVVRAVRGAVGNGFPVLLRLGAADYMEGGSTASDGAAAARLLEKAGVDLLDISGGLCRYNPPGLSGEGYFAPLARAVKEAVGIPVLLTGGVTKAESAERLLAQNEADLIGVGRAVLRDSGWAKRAVESLL